MANAVKWIKITTDIFDDEKIQMIEAMPGGDTIIVIWIKLLCLAGKQNNKGVFFLNDRMPFTEEMFAAIFHRDLQQVRYALETFRQVGMVEIIEDVVTVPNWEKYQTLDAYEKKKERDRLYQKERRERQKLAIEDKKTKKSSDKSSDSLQTTGRFCSYISYSISNSNITNLDILVTNNIYKDSDYLKDNTKLYDSIKEWMEYKDERKPKSKHHYTENGLKKLLSQVVAKAQEYGTDSVVDVIDRTIAAQYDGIGWYWLEDKAKPKSKWEDI